MLARFGFMIDLDSIGFSREFNGNEFKAFNGTYPQDVPFPLSSCTNLNLTESIPYGAHKALSAHLIEAKKNGAF